ncbi:UNVERIFIED_CONTAM: hypothetical protein FKN15_073089 [Acipenser sinensis]
MTSPLSPTGGDKGRDANSDTHSENGSPHEEPKTRGAGHSAPPSVGLTTTMAAAIGDSKAPHYHYHMTALSEALGRRFGNLSDPEGLKLKLRRWLCWPGEQVVQLVSDLEMVSWRAYASSTPGEQEEQARFQFVEALGPGELRMSPPRFP